MTEQAQHTVAEMFRLIEVQGQGDYIGERVSQLQHSLQAATLAQQAYADEETILSALLHDMGRFIPAAEREARMVVDGVYIGRESHEKLGERYLRELGFSDKICQLVGAHVMAKRYLTAKDQGYYDGLSKSSKMTLKFQVCSGSYLWCESKPLTRAVQGGIFDEAQVEEAEKDPLLHDKLAVRRWDDMAKDPDMKTPDLAAFKDMAVRSLVRSRSSVGSMAEA